MRQAPWPDTRSLAETYAHWAESAELSEIAPEVQHRVKLHILDQIGAQIGCRAMPSAKIAREYVQRHGASGPAHLLGTLLTADAEYAGFANGTAGSSFEIDDYGGNGAYSHPGCTVVPAALAMAEEAGLSGADVLRSSVLGFETVIRLALATMPSLFLERGFHHTSVLGVFAVAVTCCALSRDNAAIGANAISIAGSHAAGTTEFSRTGGEIKRAHAGIAVAAGIRAFRLARLGLTGPPTIFEGKRGFLQAYCNVFDSGLLSKELGKNWCFPDYGSIKPYAACGLFHHHFAAYDAIRKRIEIIPEQIDHIILHCEPLMMVHNGAHGPYPRDLVGAQFSAEFSMAMRIVLGRNDVGAYLDMAAKAFSDHRILTLAARVKLVEDEMCGIAPPKGGVTLYMQDGRILSETGYALGSPLNPMSDIDIQQKYLDLVARECGDLTAERSMDLIMNLERIDKISELTSILH
jgi:2-methylcitrate dehydratase PrpD